MSTLDARAGVREWTGLAVLALPVVLLSVDNTVLFLAAPELAADLRPDGAQTLWILDIYGFMIAGFLVTMGTVGDRIGRKRLLVIGAAAFGAASALAAYASSPEMLIAARAVLGIAGATVMPSSLALISTMFRDAAQRAMAIGIWSSAFMVGGAIGPIVGGLLLERFWWGSVFLMGVPVMLLLLATAPWLLPESRERSAGRLDLASVGLSLAAMLPVVYGLKEIAKSGVTAPPLLAIGAGIAVGTAFVRRQQRLPDPLLDVRMFGNPSLTAALAVLTVGMATMGGVFLFVTQHLQSVAGLTPLVAGLWLVPAMLATVISSLLAPVLARRMRPGGVVAAGLVITAIGYGALALVDHTTGMALVIGGLALAFFGTGPFSALGMDMIVGSAPPEKAGSASALAATGGEIGIALGIATLGSVGVAVYRSAIADTAPHAARENLDGAVAAAAQLPPDIGAVLLASAREAFVDGLNVVAGVSAVIAIGLALLAISRSRRDAAGQHDR
jgi:DHA2 family multidrug resistance protein-like MFS transporter